MAKPSYVSARSVRGLQVGTGNFQLNHFEYRVENCDINLGAVLSGHAVQQQLRLLAADPNNLELRRGADALLRRGRFFSRAPRHRVTTRTITTTQDESTDDVFETFLFVQDSSGVQIADGGRQENYFFYVIAPSIDASDLLRSDAELRSSLIDQVCTSSTVARSTDFHQRLSSAMEYAVLNLPDLRTSGTLVDLRKRSHVNINDEDGVSIGVRGRQRNDVSAEVAAPKALLADVRDFSENLARATRSRPLERMERELAGAIVDTLQQALAAGVGCWNMIDALNQAFPGIKGLVKRLRWGSPADLHKLRKYLKTVEAADFSALRAARKELDTTVRAQSRAPLAQSPNPPDPAPAHHPTAPRAHARPPSYPAAARSAAPQPTDPVARRAPYQAGRPPAYDPQPEGTNGTRPRRVPDITTHPAAPQSNPPGPVRSAEARRTWVAAPDSSASRAGPSVSAAESAGSVSRSVRATRPTVRAPQAPEEPGQVEPRVPAAGMAPAEAKRHISEQMTVLGPAALKPAAASTGEIAGSAEVVAKSIPRPGELAESMDLSGAHASSTGSSEIAPASDERLSPWKAASPAVRRAAEAERTAQELGWTAPEPTRTAAVPDAVRTTSVPAEQLAPLHPEQWADDVAAAPWAMEAFGSCEPSRTSWLARPPAPDEISRIPTPEQMPSPGTIGGFG